MLKEQQMETKIQQETPGPSKITAIGQEKNSDSDFVTDDEEVNKRIKERQLRKEQNMECFMGGLKDYGITKTMERAAG